MSGGGGGVVIIHAIVAHPKTTDAEKATLLDIADRSPVTCGFWDARTVAKICRSVLRRA